MNVGGLLRAQVDSRASAELCRLAAADWSKPVGSPAGASRACSDKCVYYVVKDMCVKSCLSMEHFVLLEDMHKHIDVLDRMVFLTGLSVSVQYAFMFERVCKI